MPGIPGILLTAVRQALMDCDELDSPAAVRALFVDERLRTWRNSIPSAATRAAQADLLISALAERRSVEGANALVLLLRVLAARYPGDELQARLEAIADQLDWTAQRSRVPVRTEANPTASEMVSIVDIEHVYTAARAVARIDVPAFRGGERLAGSTGTGWLVTPTLLVTCWHVLEALRPLETEVTTADLQAQLANVLVTFDYTVDGQGLQYQVAAVAYAPADKALDYAVVRLSDRAGMPLTQRGYLRVERGAPLTSESSLYIIQHPLGRPQQVAGDRFVRNSATPGRILYRTPTEPGTSGAPVLNRINWKVVALHNGENELSHLREGTRIDDILANLRAGSPEVHDEIEAAQGVAA